MTVTIPVFVLPGLLLFPFNYFVRYRFITQWANLVVWLLDVICNLRYEVEGKENIPKGAAIIFAKHQSTWETIALQQIFPPQVWVIKRELLWVPFFGWALWLLNSISIDRSSGHRAVSQIAETGTKRLQDGRWVVIFPEGTRMPPGRRRRFGVGGAVLAERSEFPVVPVAHNAGEYWSRRSWVKKPGVIKVSIGPAIDTKGKKAAEINQIAQTWIEAKMVEITTLENHGYQEIAEN